MSGLRDREALDAALVRLVISSGEGMVHSACLIRVVGEGDDRRCLVLARVDAASAPLSRDLLWTDWTILPHVHDFPLRQQAVESGHAVHAATSPRTTVVPLVTPQGIWGLLEIGTDQALSAQALELVDGILLTYNNLRGLLDYGEKDALTELLNRKSFDGAFFRATAEQHDDSLPEGGDRRHLHSEAGVWLAVLDIDHFKHVNDTFGHLIGDEVLLLLARLMRSCFRFHDQLYRFGGEEFVVLMRCDSVDHAEAALERLRERVQAYAFPQVGTITVSIGFSILLPHDTPSDAFGRADKAVYHAKEHGRNQVCSYQALVASGDLKDQVAEGMDVDLF
ncbi:GGDEF domain-containing protein [Rhodoferax saidenbachensis]|nr:GGDEF domain-containing protein [Rhodoferax saidenbachensis]